MPEDFNPNRVFEDFKKVFREVVERINGQEVFKEAVEKTKREFREQACTPLNDSGSYKLTDKPRLYKPTF